MLNPEKLFANLFSDKTITSFRLANFAHNLLSRLTAGNSNDVNTALISILAPALDNLKAELGETDTALGLQKGKTLTVYQFRDQFKETISHYEGAIALALGGSKTAAYQEFFPGGLSEYSSARITNMALLLNRLKVSAIKYSPQLGITMSKQLQELESTWQTIRNEQVQQKANLSDNRTGREDARKEMESVLYTIVHTIALRYAGNVEECMSCFDFSLLHGLNRRKKKEEDKKVA